MIIDTDYFFLPSGLNLGPASSPVPTFDAGLILSTITAFVCYLHYFYSNKLIHNDLL